MQANSTEEDRCVLSAQLCPTLCDPVDGSLSGSSVHEIFSQEYWSGLSFPSPMDLPDPGIKLASPKEDRTGNPERDANTYIQ